MKWLNCWIFYFALFLLITPTVNAQAVPSRSDLEPIYATGLVWDDIEAIESMLREDQPLSIRSALPTSINLKDSFSCPGDQGCQNSCTAWAVAYALKSHQEESVRGWGLHTDEHLFSPSYIYNQRENYDEDDGISIISAFDIMLEQGVCTLASFPYNKFDCNTQPTDEQREEAACFKALDYYSIRGIDSFKRHLANGDGIIIGVEVYPDLRSLCESNPIYDVVSGTSSGGHTITLIGYSDEKEAFEFINSWGTQWGLDGYGWISYDLINDIRVSHFGEALGFVMVSHEAPIFIENSFEYSISDLGEASIVGYIGADGEVAIPDTLGGYPVTAIGRRAFQNNKSLTGVVIPNSVLEIGPWAFSGTALNEIVIPDSVMAIGEASFQDCLMLTNIIIPDKITSIEEETFKNTGLVSVTIPESVTYIDRDAFSNCDSLTCVTISNSSIKLFYGAFSDLPDNAVIYVPDTSAKTIVAESGFPKDRIIAEKEFGVCGNDLTWDFNKESGTLTISGTGDMWDYTVYSDMPWASLCEDIKKVSIGNEVNSIGKFAFRSCSLMNEAVIGKSVTFIAEGAFFNCSSLTEVIIPNRVIYIGNSAFDCCDLLTDLVLPNGVLSIGYRAFAGSSLTNVIIPDSVIAIGNGAFSGLYYTAKIYVPDETIRMLVVDSGFPESRVLWAIAESGICGDNLTWELDIKGTLTISGTGKMWDYVYSKAPWYSYSTDIKKIVIEEGVTDVEAGVFDNCRIESLVINMTDIGLAFADMTTVKTVTLGSNVSSVADGAFVGLNDSAIIYVPDQNVRTLVMNSGFSAERILWTVVKSGICGDNLTWELDSMGTLEIFGEGDMWEHTLSDLTISDVKRLVIHNGVTSISSMAFFKCGALSDVSLPDSVTSIGMLAFNGCVSLTDVVIPDSVTCIGDEAFSDLIEFSPNEIFVSLPNLIINCNENSYAYEYAIENNIPFKLLDGMSKTIEVTPLINDIIVNSIMITSTVEEFYELAVDFEKSGDVFFVFAVYEGEQLRRTYLSDDNAHIKGITESDLKNGKIYIWDKNMQPCIEAVRMQI